MALHNWVLKTCKGGASATFLGNLLQYCIVLLEENLLTLPLLGGVGNLFDWKSIVVICFQPQHICAWILKRCETTLFLLLPRWDWHVLSQSCVNATSMFVCIIQDLCVGGKLSGKASEHQLMPCFSSSRSFPAFCPSSNNRHSVRDSFLLEIKSLFQPST